MIKDLMNGDEVMDETYTHNKTYGEWCKVVQNDECGIILERFDNGVRVMYTPGFKGRFKYWKIDTSMKEKIASHVDLAIKELQPVENGLYAGRVAVKKVCGCERGMTDALKSGIAYLELQTDAGFLIEKLQAFYDETIESMYP